MTTADQTPQETPAGEPVLAVVPATRHRFDDIRTVLAPTNPKACWCLGYRPPTAEDRERFGPDPAEQMRALTTREPPPGLLAYVGDDVAGWVGVGPRSGFSRLQRSRTIPRVDAEALATSWSVVCFIVRPGFRRRGIARALLDAAVDHARDHGARTIEAYPLDTGGARVSGTTAYPGTVAVFEDSGFVRVQETTSSYSDFTRWVVRRALD